MSKRGSAEMVSAQRWPQSRKAQGWTARVPPGGDGHNHEARERTRKKQGKAV